MGLAASQARFLGITARKSNIEYEGQQVNQQRTALAEEVNALYNKLVALDLPVAPEATDFYESNYSFEVTNTDESDGDYVVKSYYKQNDGTYYINATRTYTKNVVEGKKHPASNVTFDASGVPTKFKYSGEDIDLKTTTNADVIKLINDNYGKEYAENEPLYYFQDSDGETHYMTKTELEATRDEGVSISLYTQNYKSVTEPASFSGAVLTFDENNRVSNISYDNGETIFNSSVTTTRTYNSDGYDAALRDYTMSKDEYDKKVADLNSQTAALQQEDKVLEMRLDQIDTEQNELKTELEAIKKVLDDNIEATFKTFA